MQIIDLVVGFIVFIFPLILLVKYKLNFVYYYLVFNILIDILGGFINVEKLSIAVARALISLLFLLAAYHKNSTRIFRLNKIIVFYLIFVLLLLQNSSDYILSLSSYLKVLITLIMFPIGISLIKTDENMYSLNKSIVWILVLFSLNFILANIFQIGRTAYAPSVDFYAGNLQISALNTATWCLLILPIIFQSNYSKRFKNFTLVTGITAFIFLAISLKRISLIALAIGMLIILIFTKFKYQVVKIYLVAISLIVLLSPLYIDTLEKLIKARAPRLNVGVIENESRYLEFFYVLEEILDFENPKTFFFGKEPFNTVGNYANGMFGDRVLHSDYSLLLFSTGIIGFILYFLVYIHIYKVFSFVKKKILYKNESTLMNLYSIYMPVFFALYISSLIISFSGGMLAITHRSILFFYLGAIIGYLRNKFIINSKLEINL